MSDANTPNIVMQPCESSQLAEIGHCALTNTLAIRFKSGTGLGDLYHYTGVSNADYLKLRSAKSVGAHFHEHIRSKHKHVKITEPTKKK